eukprot:6565944-Prymnesium_polylepis.1
MLSGSRRWSFITTAGCVWNDGICSCSLGRPIQELLGFTPSILRAAQTADDSMVRTPAALASGVLWTSVVKLPRDLLSPSPLVALHDSGCSALTATSTTEDMFPSLGLNEVISNLDSDVERSRKVA